MRRIQFWITCVLSALTVHGTASAWAATYHVAMSGDDAQPGTEGQPWRTLRRANSAAQPGDVINIGPGTWIERPSISRSGTATNPITWQGTGDTTIVGGFNIRYDHIRISNFRVDYFNADVSGVIAIGEGNDNKTTELLGNYVIVDNVTFTRQGSTALNAAGNFPHYTGPVGSICKNSRFFNCSTGAAVGISASQFLLENSTFTSSNGGDAILLFGRNNTIRGCRFIDWNRPEGSTQHTDLFQSFTNNGQTSIGHIIENNFMYNCLGTQFGNTSDLALKGNIRDWVIRNNVLIRVSNPWNQYCSNFSFYNNTFFKSPCYAGNSPIINARETWGTANENRIFNNIYYKCGSVPSSDSHGYYAFALRGLPLTGFEADNNLVIGEGAGLKKGSSWTWFRANQNGFNGVDPLFVNSVNPTKPEDLRLQANSPVIGEGRDLSEFFTTDFSGRQRGAKWDIGALQSGKGLSAPTGFRTQ